jgi:hypothetical protein
VRKKEVAYAAGGCREAFQVLLDRLLQGAQPHAAPRFVCFAFARGFLDLVLALLEISPAR